MFEYKVSTNTTLDVANSIAVDYRDRGDSLLRKCDFEAAVRCYREALEWGLDSPGLHYSLAMICEGKARYMSRDASLTAKYLEESQEEFKRAIELRPSFALARYHLASLYLLHGDFATGWLCYESRFEAGFGASPCIPHVPIWHGEWVRGATILLHGEQGLGDVVQFVRYAQFVAERGGRVVVAAPKPLQRLLSTMRGVDRVIEPGEPCPEATWQCTLMSLPLIFRTELETIPSQVPYLYADPLEVKAWTKRLAERNLRVGIVWSGETSRRRNDYRSMPVELLAPLSRVEGVSLFSLQKGQAAEQLTNVTDMKVQDIAQDCVDMAETAAAITALDLVVTVDTAVAHLAGALNKPVWIMLPYMPCWRWLLSRQDSPWYPTATLFRQSVPGDWYTVVNEVTNALKLASNLKLSNRCLAGLGEVVPGKGGELVKSI